MAEIRARVTQATFDRLRAIAERNGVNLTAMISILINRADDPTPQIADKQRTDSGVVTKVNDANHSADSGGSGTNSGQIAESVGDIGGNGSFSGETKKPKERKPHTALTGESRERFERFYEAYPSKKSPGDAERAWPKHDPGDDRFVAVIEAQVAEREAKIKAGMWVTESWPYPATWLNKKRYLDQIETPKAEPPKVDPKTLIPGTEEFRQWRISQLKPTA